MMKRDRRTTRATLAALIAVAAVLASACSLFGGGGAAPKPRGLEVELGEFYFKPESIEIQRGQEATIHLENAGGVIHNFRVDEFQVDQDVEAGRSETVTFTPDRSGEFRILCDIPGHSEAGMVATLNVVD